MANLTKGQRAAEERIKAAILAGAERGVCDRDGRSVKVDGIYRPKYPARRYTKKFVDGKWINLALR